MISIEHTQASELVGCAVGVESFIRDSLSTLPSHYHNPPSFSPLLSLHHPPTLSPLLSLSSPSHSIPSPLSLITLPLYTLSSLSITLPLYTLSSLSHLPPTPYTLTTLSAPPASIPTPLTPLPLHS